MNDAIKIHDYAGLDVEKAREIAEIVEKHQRLVSALQHWAAGESPAAPARTVAQDEFSNDVVFSFTPDLFLAYEVT